MRYLFIILSVLLLSSCGSYRIQQRQPQISTVLAITNDGDTIQVPIQELQRKLTPQDYPGWNFYWNNSWWMYNDWYWNYYQPNPRLFAPRYYIYTPRPRVVVPQQPRRVYVPRHVEPRSVETPIRGRSNQTHPRVQQPQPRVQQTPRQPQPPRPPQRTQSPVRQQQTRGGINIKQ